MENRNSLAPAPRSIESEDVTTWSLPEGAIARLGQGLAEALVFMLSGKNTICKTIDGRTGQEEIACWKCVGLSASREN